MLRRRFNERISSTIWPGFVDVMTALLLTLFFMLSIFMVNIFVQDQTIQGQDAALGNLSDRIRGITDILRDEQTRSSQLVRERDELARKEARLAASLAATESDLRQTKDQLELAAENLLKASAQREGFQGRLSEAELKRQALEALVAELETSGATNAERLSEAEKELAIEVAAAESLRKRLKNSTAKISAVELALDQKRKDAEEALTLLAAAQAAREDLELELSESFTETQKIAALMALAKTELADAPEVEDQAELYLLNEQLSAVRGQLASISTLLDATEAKGDTLDARVENLGTRLNAALAQKVDELAKFRSEFFGRVRGVVEGKEDIEIVGDRFVFQSEVLFSAGSEQLGIQGEHELAKFADILLELAAELPDEVNWILRIDGHTDARPIKASAGSRFSDNWELSQARALSVARFLINEHGVPPSRLAATGFGEFQPLDTAATPEAWTKNRRIELKLTER